MPDPIHPLILETAQIIETLRREADRQEQETGCSTFTEVLHVQADILEEKLLIFHASQPDGRALLASIAGKRR